MHDNAAGIALPDKVAADTDTVQKALVDHGFESAVVAHGTEVGTVQGGGGEGSAQAAADAGIRKTRVVAVMPASPCTARGARGRARRR
ncbi:hypothetical protein NGM37_19970, partial [Streptomyces sp. TRM76130]|nr:hypothetical protein [Streptomyces sp. TRM76130]